MANQTESVQRYIKGAAAAFAQLAEPGEAFGVLVTEDGVTVTAGAFDDYNRDDPTPVPLRIIELLPPDAAEEAGGDVVDRELVRARLSR
jgi:hypothetical protein